MNLTAAELTALGEDMRYGPYLMQPSVQMLNRDHQVLSDLSERVMEGQVDCKLEGKISTRSCSLTLVDPSREVAIDGADASAGALFYDKLISAGVRFKGPRLGKWVTIPVFCGPITNAARAGWSATVTAQGKERLRTGMVWDPRSYPAGADKVDTLVDLLVKAGESPDRIVVPGIRSRLPNQLALARTDRAWAPVTSIADSLSRQAMYDGRGDFRLRSWPSDPKVIFRDGEDGTMLSHPDVTYDQWNGKNGVWLKGPINKAGKRIEAVAWLPVAHPLSPWSLAENGVPFRVAEVWENNKIRTQAEAREEADRRLLQLAREVINIQVEAMPNWLLEPGDVIGFETRSIGYAEQVLKEFSLPLTAGVGMSLGSVQKLLTRRVGKRAKSSVVKVGR